LDSKQSAIAEKAQAQTLTPALSRVQERE